MNTPTGIMRKYIVLCNDHIIKQGECFFYKDIRKLVPIGYRYLWAFNCLNLLTVNVMPTMKIISQPAEKNKETVDMIEWHKTNINQYRVAM